jgi:endonuclease/exonuclease/phosphatase (EEP) superfamily protein YafD
MIMKSISNFFSNKVVENILLFLILSGVIATIITPDLPFVGKSSDFANQIMIFYLALSMFFLLISQQRLMIAALICTGIFAFFLKETTNARIRYALPNQEEKLRLALINLSSIDSDPRKVFQYISKKNHDILIFQEYTPEWQGAIENQIEPNFSYKIALPRIDVYGLKILSQYPIVIADTIYYKDIPLLKIQLLKNNKRFDVLTAYFPPQLDANSREIALGELDLINSRIEAMQVPLIVAGVFNMVPWSAEIQDFKQKGGFTESRSGYIPSMDRTSGGIFGKPVTHIFYNQLLECTGFSVSRADNDEYGVEAQFQIKNIH